MDRTIDFTNCRQIYRHLGGTDRKFEVEYEGREYIIKFSQNHAKKTEMSTSHVNNVTSEYISSHISASIQLPTHNTVLGTYNDEVVVGCEDFRHNGEENMEFKEFVRAIYNSEEVKRVIRLDQIYTTLNSQSFSDALKQDSIERYWNTFVVDALVGNFDRHIGNWGYLSKDNQLSIAPVYDYGSSLLPQLSDDGRKTLIDNEFEMFKRCLVFPSAALFITTKKAGKVGYYDMMSSNFDPKCTAAVKRMVPKIQMEKIYQIIDESPLISNLQKEFYKKYVNLRKKLIIDRAYRCCITKDFDYDALMRLQKGIQYSDEMLRQDMKKDIFNFKPIEIPNYLHIFSDFDDDETIKVLKDWEDVSKIEDRMPSFEKKGKDDHTYKIMVNYPLSSEWKVILPEHRRFELLKDGEHVSSWNELHWLLKNYNEISKPKEL